MGNRRAEPACQAQNVRFLCKADVAEFVLQPRSRSDLRSAREYRLLWSEHEQDQGRLPMRLWRTVIAIAAAVVLAAGTARAQAPEKKDIKLGVGGAPALYYLPLALTEKLGLFKEQGLNVEVSDFKGGSQSLTALVGGSADVVTGAYEHTLRMQAKGQDILAVIELGRYPGIALARQGRPRRQDQDDRRPQGRQDRRHGARLLHQHDRLVPDGQGRAQARRRLLHRRRRHRVGHRRHPARRDRRHLQRRSRHLQAAVDQRGRRPGRDAHHRRHHQGAGRADVGGRALPQARLHGEEPQHRAGPRQRLLQDAAVAGQGDAGADHRQRARRSTGWATRRSTSRP